MGEGSTTRELGPDAREGAHQVEGHLVGGDADEAEAERFDGLLAAGVLLLPAGVDGAIYLYHQLFFRAVEVDDEGADRLLAPEGTAIEAPSAQ
jgi:hypothetical protein